MEKQILYAWFYLHKINIFLKKHFEKDKKKKPQKQKQKQKPFLRVPMLPFGPDAEPIKEAIGSTPWRTGVEASVC